MTEAVESNRLGGIDWVRRSGGSLTRTERRKLLAAIVRGQATNLVGRIKLATGRLPPRAGRLRLDDIKVPDGKLAREAEDAWREQPTVIAEHAQRTWVFGSALAAVDGARLDQELFYAGSLLHDAGLDRTVTGEDFTIRSAAIAQRCATAAGVASTSGEALADGIAVHTTPGIDPDRDGTLGFYIQSGALVDLGGLRVWDLDRDLVADTIGAHPRHNIKRDIIDLIRAEARAVPDGRFALLSRWGLPLAVRIAPFRD